MSDINIPSELDIPSDLTILQEQYLTYAHQLAVERELNNLFDQCFPGDRGPHNATEEVVHGEQSAFYHDYFATFRRIVHVYYTDEINCPVYRRLDTDQRITFATIVLQKWLFTKASIYWEVMLNSD